MSDNSFIVKKSLQLLPQATAPLNPTKGDFYKDQNLDVLQYNGSGWVKVGSGSGAGDLDTLYTEVFNDSSVADFTITGSGVTMDSVSPLNGTKSLKIVHDSTINQVVKKTIAIPEKYRGLNMTLALLAKSAATLGNVTILFRDETAGVDLQSSQQIQAGTSALSFQYGFKIPSTCQSFSYTITGLPQAGSPVTVIDDISIRSYWMGTASQGATSYQVPKIEQQSFTGSVGAFGAAYPSLFTWSNTQTTGSGIFSYNSSTGLFTVLKSGVFNISSGGGNNAVGNNGIRLYVNGSSISSNTSDTAGQEVSQSYSKILNVNDTFGFAGNVSGMSCSIVGQVVSFSSMLSTDLVPAKAMNGAASITIPKITTQSQIIIQNASFTNATITGAPTTTSGSGVFTYNSSTGVYTLLKAARVNMSVTLSAASASSVYASIRDGAVSTLYAGDESGNAVGSPANASIEADFPVGSTFTARNENGSAASVERITFAATAYETETKTWSSTQTLVQQDVDSIVRLSGGSYSSGIMTFTTVVENTGDALQVIGLNQVKVLKAGTYTISASADWASGTSGVQIFINDVGLSGYSLGITSGRVPQTATALCKVNDIIKVANPSSGTVSGGTLEVSYQGSVKAINTSSDQKIEIPTHELRFEGASAFGSTDTAIIKYDTMAKIRGDAFSVVNTAANGTAITMLKAGRLDVSAAVNTSSGAAIVMYITKNLQVLTNRAPSAQEIIASGQCSTSSSVVSASGVVDVVAGDVIRITTSSGTLINFTSTNLLLNLQEQKVSVSVSNILPQFSESDSFVALSGTPTGNGTSYTKGIRFPANIESNLGSSITFNDSPANGSEFTVNESGMYHLTIRGGFNGIGYFGLTKNTTATEGSDHIYNLPNGKVLCMEYAETSTAIYTTGTSVYLTQGDVIRPQFGGSPTSYFSAPSTWRVSVAKVGKQNVIANVTPFITLPTDIKHYFQTDKVGTWGSGNISTTYDIDTNGGILSHNAGVFTALKRCTVNASLSVQAAAAVETQGLITRNGIAIAIGSTLTATGTRACVSTQVVLEVGDNIAVAVNSGTSARVFIAVSARATSENILAEPETFNSDTANFQYATSSQYTLATLKDAPVGTILSFYYTGSSNTIIQSTAPSQTIDSIRKDGLLITGRAGFANGSSQTAHSTFAIQIGKGLKGVQIEAFNGTDRTSQMAYDYYVANATEVGVTKAYNPLTGILFLDAGICVQGGSTTVRHVGLDVIGNATRLSAYFTINGSKNPALVGMNSGVIATRAINSSGQSITSGTQTHVVWDTKTFDTNGAMNGTTYTCTESGYYSIRASILWASGTWSAGQFSDLYIIKNGSPVSDQRSFIWAAWGNNVTNTISDVFFLSKGDTILIDIYQNSGVAKNIYSGGDASNWNNLSINKIK